jgi:basic membrane lipoprotein Med (substrate-binding protein (PBP1-ABC) superfamily)
MEEKDYGWGENFLKCMNHLESKYGDELEVAFTDIVMPPDAERVIRDYIALGYGFIIVDGAFTETASKLAPEFPDVGFLELGGLRAVIRDNYSAIHYVIPEGGYLSGIIAGSITQTNKIGFIGGYDIPDIVAIYNAYVLGALSVNPDIEATDVYIGSFADPALAKEAALSLNDAGNDVILSATDLGIVGVAEAANDRGFFVINAGSPDAKELAPDLLLSTELMGVHWDTSFVETEYLKFRAGIFGNQMYMVGLSTGHLQEAVIVYDIVPEGIGSLVQETTQGIIDHTVYIPLLTEKGAFEQYIAENGLPPYGPP